MKTAHDLKVEYIRCRVAYLTLMDWLDTGKNLITSREVETAKKTALDAEIAMLQTELSQLTDPL